MNDTSLLENRDSQGQAIVADLRLALTTHSRPRPGRWVAATIVIVLAALFVVSLMQNKALEWHVIGHYMFNSQILSGVSTTIQLAIYSMAIALIAAILIAVSRLSENPVLNGVSYVYVWFFRGVPLLVLLVIWFNIGLLYPRAGIGVIWHSHFATVSTTSVVSPFVAAIAAFALQEAAYASEIIRAAMLAVDRGQRDAGLALGMSESRVLRRVLLPQALKIAVPPLTNDFINLLKSTSLVAFIAVFDLMYTAQSIYESNFKVMPLLMVASFWYVAMVTVLSIGQAQIERKLTGGRWRFVSGRLRGVGRTQ